MYPISDTVLALLESEQRQRLRITGADVNGNPIAITDADVMQGTFQIDRFSSNGTKIEIGTAIASELNFKINNSSGAFNDIRFEDAELFVEIGVRDWNTPGAQTFWIPCGYFTVDEVKRQRNQMDISALDRMMWLDREIPLISPWTDNDGNPILTDNGTQIEFAYDPVFPATVAGLITQICQMCGVTLGMNVNTLPNAAFSIPAAPEKSDSENYTARSYIQWLAQITGTCAFFDWNGNLRFSWYSAASYTCTPARRFDSTMYERDITITGLKFTRDDGDSNYMSQVGTDEYMIDLTGNPLIQGNAGNLLTNIFAVVGNYTYRPFSANVLPAPYLFPLDQVTFIDANGVSHNGVVTNVNLTINAHTMIEGKGETEKRNSYTPPNAMTAEQAQMISRAAAQARRELVQLDNSLTQQEIFDRLTDGGLEQGLALEAPYRSLGAAGEKKIYLNLDYARFGKLVADFIQGGTLTLGGLNDEAGKMQVLDENGEVIGEMGENGLYIYAGGINLSNVLGNVTRTVSLNQDYENLLSVSYNGEFMNSKTTLDGHFITLSDLVDNFETTVAPSEINITKNGNLVFWVSADTEQMAFYGEIICDRFTCNGGASGSFTTADGKTVTVTNGIITDIS